MKFVLCSYMNTKDVKIENIKEKIATELDFIALPRFSNSLKNLMEKYSEGCPQHIIKKALLLSTAEINSIHKRAIKLLAQSFED